MYPKIACITLDLEALGYDSRPQDCPILKNEALQECLISILDKYRVKLTVFVTGRILEESLPVLEKFKSAKAEFELHSYSHDIANADSEEEIHKARQAYLGYFCKKPLGYRAAWGKISKIGMRQLESAGFLYDNSVFPSYRPGVYNNIRTLLVPFRPLDSELVELPMAVIPRLRLVLGMSYLKFFGINFYKFLFKLFGTPRPLVFCMHLHDFQLGKAGLRNIELSTLAKWWHQHNTKEALNLLDNLLGILEKQGYEFAYMSELYKMACQE